MAVDGVTTQSAIGVDGNSYTSAVANDQLTSEDFLTLMLEEMKMQDPTKPMDSQQLMDSQLKMSQIDSNIKMTEAMEEMQKAYSISALSTAANMIGHVVEDGTTNSKGIATSYKVETVENKNGELYINAREITGIVDAIVNNEDESLALYDSEGYIYDGETKTDYRVQLDHEGRLTLNSDGTLKIIDSNSELVTDEAITSKFTIGPSSFAYAEQSSVIPLENVIEVR